MKDKIIEILKEVATHAITSELNPDELDNEGFEIFATRIDSLYSGGDEKSNIADSIEHIFKNNERIHGKSESIDWIKLSAHKAASYLLQSHPTPEISEEEIKERCPTCNAPVTVSWAGLELVENTGDETLATKCYSYLKWTISKTTQPEIAYCTKCGYHYDSLLKECPTCKGAKPVNFESPSALLEHEKWIRNCREKQKCDEVVYVEVKNPKDKDFDTLYFAELYDKPDGIKAIKKRVWLNPIPLKECPTCKGVKSMSEEDKLIGYINYISELISYIGLLGKELDELAILVHVHGWRTTRKEEGEKARAKLNELAKSLLLPSLEAALKELNQ